MIHAFQITLVLGLISQSAGRCFQLDNCTCQDPTKVICKLAGLTVVPKNVVPNVNILWFDLAENNITTLTNDTFKWTKMNVAENIHHLNLQENNISTIELGALNPLSNLTYLNLGANNITHFPKEVLTNHKHLSVLMLSKNEYLEMSPSGYNLPALTKLTLRHCRLKNISITFFEHMRNISQLNLANNLISHLDHDVFSSLTYLEYLSLSSNRLTSLESVLYLPPSVEVELWGNPWHCDCKLATDFHQYLTTRDMNPLLCGFTADNNFKINATSYLTMCEKPHSSSSFENDVDSLIIWIIVFCVVVLAFVAIVLINPVRIAIAKRLSKLFLVFKDLECANNEEEDEEELICTDPHATEMSTM